jgi:hypothetical protein
MRRAKTRSRRRNSDLTLRAERRRLPSRTPGNAGGVTSCDWDEVEGGGSLVLKTDE